MLQMNPRLSLRAPNWDDIQAFVLLFSQTLFTQIAFYPLLAYNIVKGRATAVAGPKVIAAALLIVITAVSVLLRGGSLALMLNVVQFYLGVLAVIAAFRCNRNLQIRRGHFWLFALFVFYEIVSYNIFRIMPLMYYHQDIAMTGSPAERAMISSGAIQITRAYGPAIHSSVSGSILAIMFFLVIRSNLILPGRSERYWVLAISILLAFLLCGSLTAIVTFLFLLLVHVGRFFTANPTEAIYSRVRSVMPMSALAAIVLIAFLSAFSSFFEALLTNRFNAGYLESIFNFKARQIAETLTVQDLLFGRNLSDTTPGQLGGDFVLLDALAKIGLVCLLGLIALLFAICPRKHRILLLAGWVSSLHYGTIFVLCGQLFFGALCANAILGEATPE